MEEKKKFYEKGWFAVLMLFLFSPVGIFLLWKYNRKRKLLNVIATIVFGIPFLFIMIAIFSPSESFEERSIKDQEQRDIAADNSESPKPTNSDDAGETETSASADVSTTETTSDSMTTPNPEQTLQSASQTSSEELRTLFVGYLNSGNDSPKNRLKSESPKELYDVVISILRTIPEDPGRGKIDAQTDLDNNILKNMERVCQAYLEIFDTETESDKMRELKDYAAKLALYKEELKLLVEKYETDNGNLLLDGGDGVLSMGFYVQNALGVSANSSVDKLLLDLGFYQNQIPPSYGATVGYEEAFGTYLPSDERCVIQPLSEYTFSQAGVYTLKVIYSGEMEVVTEQGFKSFVPVYVEVSDEFVEEFLEDGYSYYTMDSDIPQTEQAIKELLDI